MELACLTEEFKDQEKALPIYQGILNLHPDHSQANLAVGRILLEKGSEEGILHLEKTFGSDPEIVLSACGMAYHYYFDRGDEAEAEKYLAKAVETSESIQESE